MIGKEICLLSFKGDISTAVKQFTEAQHVLNIKNKLPYNADPKISGFTIGAINILLIILTFIFIDPSENISNFLRVVGTVSCTTNIVGVLFFILYPLTSLISSSKAIKIASDPMYKTAAEIKELVDVFHLLAEGWNTIKDYPELYADTPDYYERLSALREQIRQTIAVWKNDRVNDKLAKLGHGNRVEEHLLEAETLRDDLLEARQLRGPITDQQTELLANARREVNTLTQTRAARAKVNA